MKLPIPAISLLILFLLPGSFSDLFAQTFVQVSGQTQTALLDSDNRLPGTSFEWHEDLLTVSDALRTGEQITYSFKTESPKPFTGLAIGWDTDGSEAVAAEFIIKVRSWTDDQPRPEWTYTTGYIEPADSPSGLYWAMLYVTPDGSAHERFEIEITAPEQTTISYLTVTAADARAETESDSNEENRIKLVDPEMPAIISRSGWWGDLPPGELEPDYSPQQISITHAAVHHTVTANSPSNPAQVVRQIWDWHVNDNGWLDIGYNFVIDHNGNIYQGRYNPWLETTDVRGAHAGNSNSQSTGIALLGQFEPGANPQVGDPETAALDALIQLISWRFNQRGIDPLGSASIPVNPGGSEVLPTIFGHRDVSNTACPGENLYTLLPDIRNSVDTGESVFEPEMPPFVLGQNFPNPFRKFTTIPFTLEEELEVEIYLYSMTGKRVQKLFSGTLSEGEHDITLEMERDLASGVYFYEIKAGEFNRGRQMIYFR